MTLQRRDRLEVWSVCPIYPVTAVCYFDGRAPQWSERIPRSLPCNYGDGDAIVHIEDVDILQEEPRHYPKLGLGDVYSRSCELRKCLLLPCPFAGVWATVQGGGDGFQVLVEKNPSAPRRSR